jgi:hypothetical protein
VNWYSRTVNDLPVYVVYEDVLYVTQDNDGAELRYFFPAATAQPETEDEWFVLEHVLAPRGKAERVKES